MGNDEIRDNNRTVDIVTKVVKIDKKKLSRSLWNTLSFYNMKMGLHFFFIGYHND